MQHTLGTLEFTGSEHWDPFNNIFLRARPYEGVQTDATRNIQQCWELLANNVVSVCTELNIHTGLYSSLTCLNKFLSFHFQQLLLECKKRKKKYMYMYCLVTVIIT